MTSNQIEHKYWLQTEDIDEIVSSVMKGTFLCSEDEIEKVSSVFLDSPSLKFYSNYLSNHDNNTLTRLRWYGELRDHPVTIEEKQVINGIPKRIRTKASWHYFEKYLKNNGDCQDILKFSEFPPEGRISPDVLNILKLIVEQNLQPKIVIQHYRQTFRPTTNDEFYFTVDTQIDICRSLDHLKFMSQRSNEVYRFPYAIFEIKFNSNQPQIINSLLRDQIPTSIFGVNKINHCPDFSKYVYGVAAFFPLKTLGLPIPDWPLLMESVALFKHLGLVMGGITE